LSEPHRVSDQLRSTGLPVAWRFFNDSLLYDRSWDERTL